MCDVGTSQSVDCGYPATPTGSGISTSPVRTMDTMTLEEQQTLLLLDVSLEGDKARNTVTLPSWDRSLSENRADA